jgi:hypothetical protein
MPSLAKLCLAPFETRTALISEFPSAVEARRQFLEEFYLRQNSSLEYSASTYQESIDEAVPKLQFWNGNLSFNRKSGL